MPEQKAKNIHQKLQLIRHELDKMSLKKSGVNKHTKARYYELGDFMPAINKLNFEQGVTTQFNIQPKRKNGTEVAVLHVYNSDNPEDRLTWVTETAEVSIQSGQPIQNLGGKHTYMRRYVFMEAYEISESDTVEQEENEPISDEAIAEIRSAKDFKQLTAICGRLKAKYPVSMINPYFEEMKTKLNQDGGTA